MPKRSAALDGIRGIAILGVMANHTGAAIGRGGFLGVDLFFVLSGYLISTILLRERERTDRVSLRRFYARRALRLYPALVVASLLAVAFAVPVGSDDHRQALRAVGTSLAYLMDAAIYWHWPVGGALFHTWSLAIEEQFYLVWPALLIACLSFSAGRRRWPTVIATAGLVWCVAELVIGTHDAAFRPDARGGALLVGCLIALGLDRHPIALPAWVGWAGLTIAAVLMLVVTADISATTSLAVAVPLMWLAAAAIVTELAVSPHRVFARVLGWAPLAYVGLISYGLYLYHPLVYRTVTHEFDLSRRLGSSLAIAASFVLAAASYRFVESPFLRMKTRYASGGSADPRPAGVEVRRS